MLAETLPVLALDGKRPDDLDGEVSGWEQLAGAVRGGRGAELVGLHQGSWEVGARLIMSRNRLAALVYPIGPIQIDAPVQASRSASGIRTIPAGNRARDAAAVRRGEAVGALVDRQLAPGPFPRSDAQLAVRA